MKTFTTAAVEAVETAEREPRIKLLMDAGKTREEAESEIDKEDGVVRFMLDDRVLTASTPTPGQLTFMLAAMGRGQSQDSRFSSIVNIMMETLDSDGKDYLEGRLLTGNPKEALDLKYLEQIFEYLVEEWFANPTQGQ